MRASLPQRNREGGGGGGRGSHAVRLCMCAAAMRTNSLSLRAMSMGKPTRDKREAPMRPRVRDEGNVITGTPAYRG